MNISELKPGSYVRRHGNVDDSFFQPSVSCSSTYAKRNIEKKHMLDLHLHSILTKRTTRRLDM